MDGKGDVAFVPLTALSEEGVQSKDLALICPDGGRAEINEWERCNLGLEPPRVILSSGAKSPTVLEELTHGTLAASTLYSKRPDLLHLFGSWSNRPNLLFKVTKHFFFFSFFFFQSKKESKINFRSQDEAKDLVSVNKSWNKWNDWQETQNNYGAA